MQGKIEKNFESFANPRGVNFSSKLGGVSLLFRLKLNEFYFGKSTVKSSLWIKKFRKSINIKSPSLPGSRIEGLSFLKSLSNSLLSGEQSSLSYSLFSVKQSSLLSGK